MNQEYFNLLPPHIRRQFAENIREADGNLALYLSQDNLASRFMYDAFHWTDTPEGDGYWVTIQDLFTNCGTDITPDDFIELYEDYPEHSKRDEIINDYQIY